MIDSFRQRSKQKRKIGGSLAHILSFSLSILVHLVVFVSISFKKTDSVYSGRNKDKSEIAVQIVERDPKEIAPIASLAPKEARGARASRTERVGAKKDRPEDEKTFNLNLSSNFYSKLVSDADGIENESSFNQGDSPKSVPDDPNAVWGEGSRQIGRAAETLVMQAATEKVSGLIYYPTPLARRGIEGTINARIVMDRNGNCDWSKSFVGGDRSELRFYVLTLLKGIGNLMRVFGVVFEYRWPDFAEGLD